MFELTHENNQTKLLDWLVFRESCLDELLRHDGLGDFLGNTLCVSCLGAEGVYKCKDCLGGSLLRCRDCLVNSHRDHPLHRVEVRCQIFSLNSPFMRVYHSSGMVGFSPRLPFKVLAFVSSLAMAALHVLFHPLVPKISAFLIYLESITFLSISATVGRTG